MIPTNPNRIAAGTHPQQTLILYLEICMAALMLLHIYIICNAGFNAAAYSVYALMALMPLHK